MIQLGKNALFFCNFVKGSDWRFYPSDEKLKELSNYEYDYYTISDSIVSMLSIINASWNNGGEFFCTGYDKYTSHRFLEMASLVVVG